MKFLGSKFYSFGRFVHPQPIGKSTNTIDAKWHDWGARSLISVRGSPQQEGKQKEKLYFKNPGPLSNLKFSEYKFDRLDDIFAHKPISQLKTDNPMKWVVLL